MEIVSMKRNCMGTMSFTLRIGKMKKAEEFTTYPIQHNDNGQVVRLQSHHRWAELNTQSGAIEMSARRAQYADNLWLMLCKVNGTSETDQATTEQLTTMLDSIRGTASRMAGTNGLIYCDNSNANQI